MTQSGQAGIKTHPHVFSPIHNTLKSVFPKVVPYNQAIFSFLDEWGWNIGFANAAMAAPLSNEEIDARIAERINGELKFLDGISWQGVFAISKVHRKTLAEEKIVMSTEKSEHCFMGKVVSQTD